MPVYSHSRLSTFEKCSLRYKYRYIDKIIPEIEKSIEAHLGSVVHETLEWLYTEVKKGNIPSVEEVIVYYSQRWEKGYSPNIVIVKKQFTPKDYFDKGIQFILNYYLKHEPFDDNTLEIEKEVSITIDENGEYKIRGFIDRLSYNPKTGEYEIHDYKTSNSLPKKEDIESDRQLALYAIAVKELFGNEKEVSLIWHYLAHDIKICSKRTNEQLEQLKKETLELIKKIESTTEFFPNKSILCKWCEYNNICHEFNEKSPEDKEEEKRKEELKNYLRMKVPDAKNELKELDIWD